MDESPQPHIEELTKNIQPESALIGLAQAGDVSARNRLMTRMVPMLTQKLKAFASRFSRLGVSTEELISEAFAHILEKGVIDKYDPDKGTSLLSFLYVVCERHMLDCVRRKKWEKMKLLSDDHKAAVDNRWVSPEDRIISQEQAAQVKRILADLELSDR